MVLCICYYVYNKGSQPRIMLKLCLLYMPICGIYRAYSRFLKNIFLNHSSRFHKVFSARTTDKNSFTFSVHRPNLLLFYFENMES